MSSCILKKIMLEFAFNNFYEKNRPGAYEHEVERNRNVQMLHSFGGRTQSVPHVDIKCTVNHHIKVLIHAYNQIS